MGWTFPWASFGGGDFNSDFNVSITEEQQRKGDFEYNFQRDHPTMKAGEDPGPAKFGPMTGTDQATYAREGPGMSAFAIADNVVYHTWDDEHSSGSPKFEQSEQRWHSYYFRPQLIRGSAGQHSPEVARRTLR